MKDRGKAFLESYRNSSPVPFLVIFSLFLVSGMLRMPFWQVSLISPVAVFGQYLRSCILWISFIYLAGLAVRQHARVWTVVAGAVLTGAAMMLCQRFIISEAQYELLMIILLLLLSWSRNFRRMMKAALIVHCLVLAVGIIGYLTGLTIGRFKYENYGQGFAFGMNYPNTFARFIFVILILVWYLYLKDRKTILSFAAFWLPAIPIALAAKCRTVSVLMFLFPLCAMCCRSASGKKDVRAGGKHNAFVRVLILMPVICWGTTMLLALQMEMLEQLTADTGLYNLSVRFIQTGIALKQYGLSLLPQKIALNGTITAVLAGREERLLFLDGGYGYYTLRYGLLCITVILAWLCVINRFCLRAGDCALLLIAVFFNIYGLMERMPMMPEHNFLLFYPLTALPSAAAGGRS